MAPDESAPHAPLPTVPGYRLVRRLGQGGMAVVYLAVQESLDREVAIKVMAPQASSDEAQAQRFEHEARIIAKLEHPGIVGIHEVGRTAEGQLYYVMPYLAKGDLSQRHYRDNETAVVELLRGLLDALGYAHARGIVHRDVKAENVLFNNADRPQLTDFGIALSRRSGRARITTDGLALGSGGYMSPEQARGEKVDGRADLYSLGILAYELLSGDLPFHADDPLALALMHAQDPLPALPQEKAHWQSFLQVATAKNPARRFRNAQAMARGLDAVARKVEPPTGIAAFFTHAFWPAGRADGLRHVVRAGARRALDSTAARVVARAPERAGPGSRGRGDHRDSAGSRRAHRSRTPGRRIAAPRGSARSGRGGCADCAVRRQRRGKLSRRVARRARQRARTLRPRRRARRAGRERRRRRGARRARPGARTLRAGTPAGRERAPAGACRMARRAGNVARRAGEAHRRRTRGIRPRSRAGLVDAAGRTWPRRQRAGRPARTRRRLAAGRRRAARRRRPGARVPARAARPLARGSAVRADAQRSHARRIRKLRGADEARGHALPQSSFPAAGVRQAPVERSRFRANRHASGGLRELRRCARLRRVADAAHRASLSLAHAVGMDARGAVRSGRRALRGRQRGRSQRRHRQRPPCLQRRPEVHRTGRPLRANRVGVQDLVGNVGEWTLSCGESGNALARMLESESCPRRIAAGTSWRDGTDAPAASHRQSLEPDRGYDDVGFRLVREL